MMTGIVGLMTSYMKGQGIYTKFKAKYNKKEALRSITLQEEETSTLVVDSEEEEEEEVWVEVEDRSFVITAHSQDTWQGTVKTLVPLAAIAIHSSMLSRNVQRCWLSFRRNEEETNKYN
jgi:hypothetical protein